MRAVYQRFLIQHFVQKNNPHREEPKFWDFNLKQFHWYIQNKNIDKFVSFLCSLLSFAYKLHVIIQTTSDSERFVTNVTFELLFLMNRTCVS